MAIAQFLNFRRSYFSNTAPATKEIESPSLALTMVNVFDPQDSTYKYIMIDPSQAWFWTDEWQAMEREADDDLANGRYEDFNSIDEFLDSLL